MTEVLDDADDDKWIYREHTAAKHEVYQKYLTPWTYKLSSFSDKLRVVDCFAGRGSYVSSDGSPPVELECISTPAEYPGSPQIILDRLTKHSDKFSEAEAVFIENDPENFDYLSENVYDSEGVASNVNRECIHGKFQETVLDVVEATDGSDCPTLFLIDPFGFKSLDYEVVTEISSTPQFEVLITFMSRDINRFFEVEYHQDAIETVFGNRSFHEEVSEFDAENWVPLVEYYTHRLEENGPELTFEYLITEPDTQQTVYYLVFGTNHGEGLKVMREVMQTCGTGSFGYAPMHPEHDRKQVGLGSFGNTGTKDFLLQNFSDMRVEFNRLMQLCAEVRKYGDEVESDYRTAVKELEEENKVKVIRNGSAETGVGRGDLIDFRDQDSLDDIE